MARPFGGGALSEAGALLRAQHLCAKRGGTTLFEGVSFALTPGHWLQVTGQNGVGKTTLLRMVCGLSLPTPNYLDDEQGAAQPRAQMWWKNSPMAQVRDAFHLALIYLGHAMGLKEELSALENLHALCAIQGQVLTHQAACWALHAMGLKGREHLPIRVLSQGQRRRVALSRLMLHEASLWVLDEPFVALDTQGIETLLGLIEAHLSKGGALLFTSHQAVHLQSPGKVLELGL